MGKHIPQSFKQISPQLLLFLVKAAEWQGRSLALTVQVIIVLSEIQEIIIHNKWRLVEMFLIYKIFTEIPCHILMVWPMRTATFHMFYYGIWKSSQMCDGTCGKSTAKPTCITLYATFSADSLLISLQHFHNSVSMLQHVHFSARKVCQWDLENINYQTRIEQIHR